MIYLYTFILVFFFFFSFLGLDSVQLILVFRRSVALVVQNMVLFSCFSGVEHGFITRL